MITVRTYNHDEEPPLEEIWQAQILIRSGVYIYAETYDKTRKAWIYEAETIDDAKTAIRTLALNGSIWNDKFSNEVNQ